MVNRASYNSQRLHEHTSHSAAKAELQQWTSLVLLATQRILAALLTQGRIALDRAQLNFRAHASRAKGNVDS